MTFNFVHYLFFFFFFWQFVYICVCIQQTFFRRFSFAWTCTNTCGVIGLLHILGSSSWHSFGGVPIGSFVYICVWTRHKRNILGVKHSSKVLEICADIYSVVTLSLGKCVCMCVSVSSYVYVYLYKNVSELGLWKISLQNVKNLPDISVKIKKKKKKKVTK